MGKSTISMAIFNSYVTNYQRVSHHSFLSCWWSTTIHPDWRSWKMMHCLPYQFRSLEQGVPSQHGVLETDPFGDASFGGNSSCRHGESQVTMYFEYRNIFKFGFGPISGNLRERQPEVWWIFKRELRTPEGIYRYRYMHLQGLVSDVFFSILGWHHIIQLLVDL